MRSIRPLRLEALEDRFAPADPGLIDPTSVEVATTTTLVMPPPPTSAFIDDLMNPDCTFVSPTGTEPVPTTTVTPTSSLGDLMDPIGTPINP